MTDPIAPIAGVAAADPRPQSPDPTGAAPSRSGLHIEMARAQEAPVYVYRVLDDDTGRVLVEIPRRSADDMDGRPGQKVNRLA